VKKTFFALVVALVIVPVSQGAAAARMSGSASLPAHGVLTPGVSLAGIRVGDTIAKVKATWGNNYKICPDCSRGPVYYYIYGQGEPLGAAVRFRQGRVVAAFTLGSPVGWHTAEGLLMGQQINAVTQLYGQVLWHVCIGYGAMSMRNGNTVTSIYTTGEAVYGFAITALNEPICQ